MNADLLLGRVALVLQRHKLDAVLIGNAAAALQGAPVSTIDLDFLFRKTPANIKKLKAIATDLGAVILRPYYPVSGWYRVVRDEDGLQLDFMSVIDGIRSFEVLKKRSRQVNLGDSQLNVAAMPDIIRSKEAAGRDRDLAVLEILRRTYEEACQPEGKARRTEEGK